MAIKESCGEGGGTKGLQLSRHPIAQQILHQLGKHPTVNRMDRLSIKQMKQEDILLTYEAIICQLLPASSGGHSSASKSLSIFRGSYRLRLNH